MHVPQQTRNVPVTPSQMPRSPITPKLRSSSEHIEQRALDLRAAGMPGTLQELRVRSYLDLLQETDSRPAPGHPGGPDGSDGPGGPGSPGGSDGSGGSGGADGSDGPEPPASEPGRAGGSDPGPS